MMNEFRKLHELLREEARATVEQKPGESKSVTLVEEGFRDYALRITGIPDDTIAFRTDVFPSPESMFNNNKHECKRADYVIIARKNQKNWIIYVELKQTTDRRWEIICQLRGARCVIAYCRSIMAEFWNDKRFLQGYKERFVCIKNIGIHKLPTRELMRPINNNPDNVRMLLAPNGVLQFRKLLK
jgi:hypothetical protein